MRVDFTGRTAAVTGGANGIGLAIARSLADCGATVYILDLERENPAEVGVLDSDCPGHDRRCYGP